MPERIEFSRKTFIPIRLLLGLRCLCLKFSYANLEGRGLLLQILERADLLVAGREVFPVFLLRGFE